MHSLLLHLPIFEGTITTTKGKHVHEFSNHATVGGRIYDEPTATSVLRDTRNTRLLWDEGLFDRLQLSTTIA